MSQYRIQHCDYFYLLGWDRPLQHFFLTVYKETGKDPVWGGSLDLLWSSIDQTATGGLTFDELICTCERFSLPLPVEVKEALTEDEIGLVDRQLHRFDLRTRTFTPPLAKRSYPPHLKLVK